MSSQIPEKIKAFTVDEVSLRGFGIDRPPSFGFDGDI
jgi:hypothetical protein